MSPIIVSAAMESAICAPMCGGSRFLPPETAIHYTTNGVDQSRLEESNANGGHPHDFLIHLTMEESVL